MWGSEVQIPETADYRRSNPSWIPEQAFTIRGFVQQVIDSATLRFDDQEVTLAGIRSMKNEWCPGRNCQFEAKHALSGLLPKDRIVYCAPVEWSPEGRQEAMCTTQTPSQPCDSRQCWMNWQMVSEGHAIAERERLSDHEMIGLLIRAEDDAIRGRRGIWAQQVKTAPMARPESMSALPWQTSGKLVSVEGTAEVLDGATLRIKEKNISLWGVQRAVNGGCRGRKNRNCEAKARAALEEMIGGEEVECTWTDGMTYREGVHHGFCTTPSQRENECIGAQERCSLNYEVVRGGWGLWIAQVRGTNKARRLHEMVSAEDLARKEKAGMWQGKVRIPKSFEEFRMTP